jgi:hypothetical protein
MTKYIEPTSYNKINTLSFHFKPKLGTVQHNQEGKENKEILQEPIQSMFLL